MRQAITKWAERLSKKAEAAVEQTPPVEPAKTADDVVQKMLVDNPGMNASTTVNTMKAEGIEFTKKETEMSSTAAALTRDGVKPQESALAIRAEIRLRETAGVGDVRSKPKSEVVGWTKFKAILIQEGLGNLNDAFFYTREALQSAIPIFEGKKIYADHPSRIEEQDRPERSVRDVLGHFENIEFIETDDGRGQLIGDVVILPDEPFEWARSLMRHAYDYAQKYPDKSFIGLSINAMGDAIDTPIEKVLESSPESARLKVKKAQEMGITTVRVCQTITDAVSCDLVTEAGAGGKVTQLVEGAGMKKQENIEKKEGEQDPSKLAAEADGEKAPAAGGEGHDDAAKDLELIMSVLDKMGLSDEGEKEEAKKLAMEALEALKAEGMESAIHGVEGVLRMAKREKSKTEAAAKTDEEKAKECGDAAAKEADGEKKDDAVKESARLSKENLELKAKLQKFEEAQAKGELNGFIDQKLAESKLPRASTKAFRESAGDIRSREEFETKFKIWTDAQKIAGEREPARLVFTEKAIATEAGSATTGKTLDFSHLG